MPEKDWLTNFKIGLIVAIAGSLMGIVGAIYALGSIAWALGTIHRTVPGYIQVRITIPTVIPAYFIFTLFLDFIALIFSISLYGEWSQIKTKEYAEGVYSRLIILVIITVLAMNIIALIGAVIAIYGILSGFPGLKFKLSSRSSERISPKVETISPNEAYQRLLETYRVAFGVRIADKMLENEINKLVKKGLTREEAIMTLYKKMFH